MSAPTLIVGLGGKGSDIALRVAEMCTPEQRKNIGFAVFDTDVNELAEISKKNPHVKTIQTSTKLSVGEYLDIDTHARDTWFPVNAILNSKTLTEGAGQVRAISRLALETAIRAGKMEPLHRAIEDLYKLEGNRYEQSLRVIIVSTLAGGTGSGLILPVALYIKNYLATHFRQGSNITRGFFILPEVLYEVIPGTAERNNLKSNAYATLRELDAFLMKGDATLPEKFQKSVKIDFPSTGSDGYEEYAVRPFDFCFLFDAQNADGKKLNSFEEYLDHAANCIYAQSIGPMNKRSNSSEDNTIRKLCQESGRNRYAGAGTSMLIYPKEDIQQFIALNWVKENVSQQWLVFDQAYKEQLKSNAERRRSGQAPLPIKPSTSYMETVASNANNGNSFANSIMMACATLDEKGFRTSSYKWDEYIKNLIQKIKEDFTLKARENKGDRERISGIIGELSSVAAVGEVDERWRPFIDCYKDLVQYYEQIRSKMVTAGGTMAYNLYRTNTETATSDKQAFRLETYLRDDRNQFMHPCAIRLYLYHVADLLDKQFLYNKKEKDKLEKFFASFEKDTFDDPDTEDKQETVEDLVRTKHISLADKIKRRLSADQEELQAKYSAYLSNVDKLGQFILACAVIEEGQKYVEELIKAYEALFTSLEGKINSLDKQIATIRTKHDRMKGSAARYVCASPTCMDKLIERMPYTGSLDEVDSKLTEDIYKRVLAYSLMTSKPNNDDFYSDIFKDGIMGYFIKSVTTLYGDIINMDAVSAIELEIELEKGITAADDVRAKVIEIFDEAKVLAAPFIEKPLGEEKDPINSCTFSDKLIPEEDCPRRTLLLEQLMNFGGKGSNEIAPNMILFYKSFYGLRANDLSKFAPPQSTDTYSRPAGEYYKAYFELISKIHPLTHKSKVITPHIDRWWHTVSMMPDLDEGNQKEQEDAVSAAFFWSIAAGYIDLYETGFRQQTYRLTDEALDVPEDMNTLVVSNGTPCDKLYEVMDAFAIYPDLVAKVLKRVENEIKNEVNANKDIKKSLLLKRLGAFRLKEYPLYDSEEENAKPIVRSIFDLPLIMKKSMISDIYDEEKVTRLLRVEIKEIEKYVAEFCVGKEFPEVAGEIIQAQFAKFLEDIELEKASWRHIYQDFLFDRTCSIVAMSLEELGLRDEADEVREKCRELKAEN